MKLDNRLHKIASLVKKDAVLVDIGCDHGFLCIYLAQNNIIKKAYASDVNQGPLDNVKANILKYSIENVESILSNGLNEFNDIYFDTVVIAGMGGTLIEEILANDINLIKDKHLILQPNINSKRLRESLLENDIKIVNEFLVLENNIIYEIIEADGFEKANYSLLELEYGRINLERNEDILHKKMMEDLLKYQDILSNMPSDIENYKIMNDKITRIERFIHENS